MMMGVRPSQPLNPVFPSFMRVEVQQLANQQIISVAAENRAPSVSSTQADASELALSALRCFKPFLQDVSIVYRVLETLLVYLDKEKKWDQEQFVEVGGLASCSCQWTAKARIDLSLTCPATMTMQSLLGLIKHACGDQTFPLFTSLMRHSSTPGLTPRQRTVIIQQAVPRVSPPTNLTIDSFSHLLHPAPYRGPLTPCQPSALLLLSCPRRCWSRG